MPDVAGWYLHIKSAHIGLVLASGGLFARRGALVLAGQGWAMARHWRILSYGIDTLLLTAGVTLRALLSLNPVVAYLPMASVALAHHPLGLLHPWVSHGG